MKYALIIVFSVKVSLRFEATLHSKKIVVYRLKKQRINRHKETSFDNEKNGEQQSFLFHDYETFGTSPSLDRPAQFAAIRTDCDLNVIGEPEVFYCKPADDYPAATTGGDDYRNYATGSAGQRRQRGRFRPPHQRSVHGAEKPCIVGYNNVRFDDEVSRNIFLPQLLRSVRPSWQHDNSRWDLLDVMRACYAPAPGRYQLAGK